jgi:ArsR family transcriptional regulator
VARLLVEGAFSVGELQQVLVLGQSTASHHLKILVDAGLVTCRREGRLAYYHWREPLPEALEALRAFVRAHGGALDAEARRRLHGVFEARTDRSRRFFEQAGAGRALHAASEKALFAGGDAGPAMLAWLPAADVVADLGTGSGRQLARLRGRARSVIAVDASPRMLEAAGELCRRERWDDVELRLGTLEHLPLRDGEADAAFAHLVLHHAARPERAFAEVLRVLRPGGVLVVGDYLPHDEEWMRDELADQWLGFDPPALLRLAPGFAMTAWTRAPDAGGLPLFVAALLKEGDAARRRWFEAEVLAASATKDGSQTTKPPTPGRAAAPGRSRGPRKASRGEKQA